MALSHTVQVFVSQDTHDQEDGNYRQQLPGKPPHVNQTSHGDYTVCAEDGKSRCEVGDIRDVIRKNCQNG